MLVFLNTCRDLFPAIEEEDMSPCVLEFCLLISLDLCEVLVSSNTCGDLSPAMEEEDVSPCILEVWLCISLDLCHVLVSFKHLST